VGKQQHAQAGTQRAAASPTEQSDQPSHEQGDSRRSEGNAVKAE